VSGLHLGILGAGEEAEMAVPHVWGDLVLGLGVMDSESGFRVWELGVRGSGLRVEGFTVTPLCRTSTHGLASFAL